MKQLSIILFMMLGAICARAQENYRNDQVQTLFTNQQSNGWYGAFSLGYSEIDGRDALMTGARGMYVFDQSLAIGLGGYGFVNNLDYHHSYYDNSDPRFMLAGGYGGLIVEPIFGGRKAVHLSFPLLVGIGGVALLENDGWGWDWDPYYPGHEIDNDVFFVLEPSMELEFNLTRWFRAAAYASYRFTSNIEIYETGSDALEGFSFGMTFKFGKLN
ncbi:hypothetical protein [Maribellus sp. YY47]|uniref:hypothetical protein n=1 Tax=Maribellus sp. YY47 TaxID=2929486 RepID=UPI0020018E63|nr:hypothetical protein [Maribellus sp. YY47]MCK3682531.1 hypothetical protein [Maribellus sp. YY47]